MNTFALFRILCYAVIFLGLLLIPIGFFEAHSFCLYYNLFHIKCFGCGITRATVHILHGNFAKAWAYNPLAFVALPLCGGLALFDFYRTIKNLMAAPKASWKKHQTK